MITPEEIAAQLERLQKGWLNSEKIGQLRKSLKLDDDGNLKHVSQDGKFNIVIGKVAGGEVHIGDKFVIGYEDLYDLMNPPEINWQEASRTILEQKTERLTTNPMTRDEGIFHKTEQVYIPLGLVERKKQSQKENDVSPEQGSSLYEETEITRKFEHREFISRVLVEGDSPKSKGRRISIIGEPGAGKTTSLQQISNWIANNVDDAIVIWISMADLQGKSIEDYLFNKADDNKASAPTKPQNWLREMTLTSGCAKVSRPIKDEFVSLFQQGNIWLMLDGIDEISTIYNNPLNDLNQQLTGTLLSQARVILTCRLNLWDGNRHSLDNFDIYRTLEFSYPLQVESFIRSCLASREKVAIAESLCVALSNPEAKRIQDLVKNPLRLTLLCFIWSRGAGALPETQAELYSQYVEEVYKWRGELFPYPVTNKQREVLGKQQKQLNASLSMLSCRAIDGAAGHQNSRFRLKEELVREYLDKPLPGSDGTILDLALKIGWINQVGLDATDPTQKVYAFYHTTFEEYFAAIGIEQGNFFFSHSRWNINSKKNSYRLLEPYWKQVFILWCGRANIDTVEKDKLIENLIHFKDGCRGFYSDRAFFIACDGINEFDSIYAKNIVKRLMRWRKSSLLDFLLHGEEKTDVRQSNAIEAIKQTQFGTIASKLSVQHLTDILQKRRSQNRRDSYIAALLEATDPGNELAIQTLLEAVINKRAESHAVYRGNAVRRLGEIVSPTEQVIRTLCGLLKRKEITGSHAVRSLKKLVENNNDTIVTEISKSIKTLGEYCVGNEDDVVLVGRIDSPTSRAIEILDKAGEKNERALDVLMNFLEYKVANVSEPRDITSIHRIVKSLRRNARSPIPKSVIEAAEKILHDNNVTIGSPISLSEVFEERRKLEEEAKRDQKKENNRVNSVTERAVSLLEVDDSGELIMQEMLRITTSTDERAIKREAIRILAEISQSYPQAVPALICFLKTSNDEHILKVIAKKLSEIGLYDKELIEILINRASDESSIGCASAATESLGEIQQPSSVVIDILTKLVNSDEEIVSFNAAKSLRKICNDHEPSLHLLRKFSQSSESIYIRIAACGIIGRLGNDENRSAVESLICIAKNLGTTDVTTRDAESICMHVYDVLLDVAEDDLLVISELCELLEQDTHIPYIPTHLCLLEVCQKSNKAVVPLLLSKLEESRNEYAIRAISDSLGTIGKGNRKVAYELARILGESTRDVENLGFVYHADISNTLEEIGVADSSMTHLIVRELRRFRRHGEPYKLLLKCSEMLPYKDFRRFFRQGSWIQLLYSFRPRTWRAILRRMKGWYAELKS